MAQEYGHRIKNETEKTEISNRKKLHLIGLKSTGESWIIVSSARLEPTAPGGFVFWMEQKSIYH